MTSSTRLASLGTLVVSHLAFLYRTRPFQFAPKPDLREEKRLEKKKRKKKERRTRIMHAEREARCKACVGREGQDARHVGKGSRGRKKIIFPYPSSIAHSTIFLRSKARIPSVVWIHPEVSLLLQQ